MTNAEVYQKVNEKIFSLIEQGTMPWQATWNRGFTLPTNYATGQPYRGINIWLLSLTAMDKEYAHNQWITYRQALAAGGHVKRGEHSPTFVVIAKMIPKSGQQDVPEEEKEFVFLYRTHAVFNVDQCEGLELADTGTEAVDPIPEAEAIVAAYRNKPPVRTGPWNPCYLPGSDEVRMPGMPVFHAPEEYYGALFHELAHSTGHKSRMDRDLSTVRFTASYGKEEMIAEFSASYLRAVCGISYDKSVENSADYIKGWSKAVNEDPRMVVSAASAASKVVEYMLDQGAGSRKAKLVS